MRISELSDRSGVPVATIKYYLRERLLPPGEALNARESSYGEEHLARLRLIRGLVHVVGVTIVQVRQVLSIIDDPHISPLAAMAEATAALPATADGGGDRASADGHRAHAVLTQLGYRFDPLSPLVRELDTALEFAESVGIDTDDEQIRAYGTAAHRIASADFARIPWGDTREATAFAVLGTALYEPVLLALRRLAHNSLALERDQARDEADPVTPRNVAGH